MVFHSQLNVCQTNAQDRGEYNEYDECDKKNARKGVDFIAPHACIQVVQLKNNRT